MLRAAAQLPLNTARTDRDAEMRIWTETAVFFLYFAPTLHADWDMQKYIYIPQLGNVVVSHGHSDCCGPGPPLGMSINNASCMCENSGRSFNRLLLLSHGKNPTFWGVTFIFKKMWHLFTIGGFVFLNPVLTYFPAARNCQPLTSHRNSRWPLILNALTYLFNSLRGLLVWAGNLK